MAQALIDANIQAEVAKASLSIRNS